MGTETPPSVLPPEELYRVYTLVGEDGYPPEWHATIKHHVREQAGHRCVRCLHPYVVGGHKMERDPSGKPVSWSPCDGRCVHGGPMRHAPTSRGEAAHWEARARILTVHHLDGDKANCRWWNLAALCQRCHLTIQGRVVLARVWPWEHSEWFKPYAAGWYASAYLGEELSRDETIARLGELLALERIA